MDETYLSTWNTYQAAWSDITPTERQKLLSSSVAENCVYTDPTDECHGHKELISKIERSQQRRPGVSFKNDKLLTHHAQGLSNWTMYDAKGGVILRGMSYARFGEDGRLTQMSGFFEPPAS
jgi:hypothetical protein